MTCIIGMKIGSHVEMHADGCGYSGAKRMSRTDKKIYRNGKYLIGFTSSYRMGQLLAFASLPDAKNFQEMVTVFVPYVRTLLASGAYTSVSNSREEGGEFLVAFEDQLFCIHSDFQVSEIPIYHAIGSGGDTANAAIAGLFQYFYYEKLPNMDLCTLRALDIAGVVAAQTIGTCGYITQRERTNEKE
jgi:ATP-dependent protease HslVU (ClpYQ) peptidase subunit